MTDSEFIRKPRVHDVDLDEKLYRVFSYEFFLKQVQEKNNYLRRPDKWDDPMENLLLRLPWSLDDGTPVSVDDQLHSWVGQCWSRNPNETDQMWRIYAPAKNGVMVCSTARKLLNTISNEKDDFNHMKSWLMAVEYTTEKKFVDLLLRPDAFRLLIDTEGQNPARLLRLKRESFRHENEVRLLHHDLNVSKGIGTIDDGKIFDADPNDLFEWMILDPRFTSAEYSHREHELRTAGYKNSISHSPLYRVDLPPGHKIVISY